MVTKVAGKFPQLQIQIGRLSTLQCASTRTWLLATRQLLAPNSNSRHTMESTMCHRRTQTKWTTCSSSP